MVLVPENLARCDLFFVEREPSLDGDGPHVLCDVPHHFVELDFLPKMGHESRVLAAERETKDQ